MAKESSRAVPSTASARLRKQLVRREGPAERFAGRLMRSPVFGWALVMSALFIAVCGSLAAWTRERPLVSVGRVMNETAIVRLLFTVEDPAATEKVREQARQSAPHVYVVDNAALEEIAVSLDRLPKTLGGVPDVEQVAAEIRTQFNLTAEGLAAVQRWVTDGEVAPAWSGKVTRLMHALHRTPILDAQTFQRETQGVNKDIELRGADSAPARVASSDAVSAEDGPRLSELMGRLARDAGFAGAELPVVVSRLTINPHPTFTYDAAATTELQNAAAARVGTAVRESPPGQVIFARGDVLTAAQHELYAAELEAFTARGDAWRVWLRRLSVAAAVGAVALAAAGYIGLFCPRIRASPRRLAGLALLSTLALAISCLATVAAPSVILLSAVAPTVFVAVILVVAYDQRVALAMGALQALLVCIALDQPIGLYAVMITGIGVSVWQLREIRDRRTPVLAGASAGLALALGTTLVALIDRPLTPDALWQTLADAALAGVGGLGVGIVTLALLPLVERMFDITTGMTLIELRDPRQTLLRHLLQRAPGTYNHSLNVASISEAAAEAVGANALLTYVGSLYHDIGKMNKPDYFVENLGGGPNKHEKLSPAMSLLVIVGHVKDGLALAREYDLPRSLQHFIEAHHGTTLVEFFYQRARQQAEQRARAHDDAAEPPAEIEYRYPGPKPQTKEVAIVMLADAVESATRTMAEPTPSRIDALVRALANKRLMDGQFDQCELTLRELQTICESISKTVASIYHGRVLYPSTSALAGGREERRA